MDESKAVEYLVKHALTTKVAYSSSQHWNGNQPLKEVFLTACESRLSAMGNESKKIISKSSIWNDVSKLKDWKPSIVLVEMALRCGVSKFVASSKDVARKCLSAGRLDLVERMADVSKSTVSEVLGVDATPWKIGQLLIAAMKIRDNEISMGVIKKWDGWERSMKWMLDAIPDGASAVPREEYPGSKTVFHHLCLYDGVTLDEFENVANEILYKNWDINSRDGAGQNALFEAVKTSTKLCKFLLANGCDPNEKNNLGLMVTQIHPSDVFEKERHELLKGLVYAHVEADVLKKVESERFEALGKLVVKLLKENQLFNDNGKSLSEADIIELGRKLNENESVKKRRII